MVQRVNVNTLSSAALLKAVNEGRVVGVWAYGRKQDVPRQGGGGGGGSKKKSPRKTGTNAMPAAQAGTESIVIEAGTFSFGLLKTAPIFHKVQLNGAGAHAALAAIKDREPVILGARAEISFPMTASVGRWAIATAHQVSPGDKTVQQLAKVRGVQLFDSVNFVDKWTTIGDLPKGPIFKEDDQANDLIAATDLRSVVFAVASTADVAVTGGTFTLHVTVRVRKVNSAVVDL